ncbi:MAG: DegT/DnrJ/EryC1/StrS family aminotransferase [Acidobacteriia bacterium]|nr:DegT/DnrJ/EryC1/StrS family aminotransferase [Terriglobia bacterium]
MNEIPYIPFHRPDIGQEEIDAVVQTLRSGWLTTGPRTEQFEREFAAYVQSPCAQAVNSCTAGLHVALAALGIGSGDEVITTPLTFCATVNCILQTGATPVLADVGPDGNIDPDSIAQRITGRTRAIMPVHLGGLACDMDAIWSLAREHRLFVIEDAAHAVGSHYRGRPIGAGDSDGRAASDAVVFSFYATKNLTTGEGGMVTMHDPALADRMRVLCLHGISKDAWNRYTEHGSWYYEVQESGFKYNLSDIQSAIGIHQLRKLETSIQVRAAYTSMYNHAFAGLPELEVPPQCHTSRHSWHLYMLRLNLERLGIDRNEFIRVLKRKGIGCSVHFIPIPLHPFFAADANLAWNHCPRALALYPRLVSLPLYPNMTEDQVLYVIKSVQETICSARKTRPVGVSAAITGELGKP